jgi:hypothetical protein
MEMGRQGDIISDNKPASSLCSTAFYVPRKGPDYWCACFNMLLQEMRIDGTHQSRVNIGCTKGFKSKKFWI